LYTPLANSIAQNRQLFFRQHLYVQRYSTPRQGSEGRRLCRRPRRGRSDSGAPQSPAPGRCCSIAANTLRHVAAVGGDAHLHQSVLQHRHEGTVSQRIDLSGSVLQALMHQNRLKYLKHPGKTKFNMSLIKDTEFPLSSAPSPRPVL
jgi:hypothetical protein